MTAMHCPNCGTISSSDQKFCRSCGLSLEKVYQLLAEQLPTVQTDIQNQKSKFEKLGSALWIGAAAIVYISIFWGIISEIIIGKGHVLGGILFLAVVTAILLGGLLMAYSSYLEKKRSIYRQSDKPEALPKADTAPELLSSIHPDLMTGITDHTTELLENNDIKDSGRRRSNESNA